MAAVVGHRGRRFRAFRAAVSVIFCFFFFFQAEDGIRDWSVTGVQTCALPILSRDASHTRYAPGTTFQIGKIELLANTSTYIDAPFHRYDGGRDVADYPLEAVANLEGSVRSEERRVGKEGRARRPPADCVDNG